MQTHPFYHSKNCVFDTYILVSTFTIALYNKVFSHRFYKIKTVYHEHSFISKTPWEDSLTPIFPIDNQSSSDSRRSTSSFLTRFYFIFSLFFLFTSFHVGYRTFERGRAVDVPVWVLDCWLEIHIMTLSGNVLDYKDNFLVKCRSYLVPKIW